MYRLNSQALHPKCEMAPQETWCPTTSPRPKRLILWARGMEAFLIPEHAIKGHGNRSAPITLLVRARGAGTLKNRPASLEAVDKVCFSVLSRLYPFSDAAPQFRCLRRAEIQVSSERFYHLA